MDETLKEFIRNHRHDNVGELALKTAKRTDIDTKKALQQIEGWQIAEKKLPEWAANDNVEYPRHLSMEQCSSQTTAQYKAQLAKRLMKESNGATIENKPTNSKEDTENDYLLTDLTGGLGVDFYYMAKALLQTEDKDTCKKVLFVEQQEELCLLAHHNFKALNLKNTEIINADSTAVADKINHTSIVFIDPARRNQQGARTYAIADCTPNAIELLPKLQHKADHIVMKLSPMLDLNKAIEELNGVSEVHIVGTKNECKELLIVISNNAVATKNDKNSACPNQEPVLTDFVENNYPTLFCHVDDQTISFSANDKAIATPTADTLMPDMTLAEPTSCLMKTAMFGAICQRYKLKALAQNSHIFVAETAVESTTMLRTFKIKTIASLNKKDIKQVLKDIKQANITTRNFPLTADQLRKRLKLKDGGSTYIFATTDRQHRHLMLICEKNNGF